MRSALAAIAVLASCTQPVNESATWAPPQDPVTLQSMALPSDTRPHALSGYVTRREGDELLLDSGGPSPVPLRLDARTRVTLDGHQGVSGEIREGDVVRAGYRYDQSGTPLAFLVVANSRPVTGRATPPSAGVQPQQAPPAESPQVVAAAPAQPAAAGLPMARPPAAPEGQPAPEARRPPSVSRRKPY